MKHFLILVLALPLPVLAFPAAPDSISPSRPWILAEAKRLSLDEAVEAVKRQSGGRILAAEGAQMDGRDGYRIKVLTSGGEVRVFFVDALSGAVR